MALTAAQQVALDLAEFCELHEKPDSEWIPVVPEGWRSLIAGYRVLPHVQSFADEVRKATGVQSIGTYPGHSPSIDRALDLFTPVNSRTLGDAICAYAMGNLSRFGVRYLIYRQHIWHRLDPVWRWMEDRGDLTQNHFDHVHISFETTAAVVIPDPPTKPEPRGDLRMLTFRYIFDNVDWVFDGPSGLFFQCDETEQITEVLDPLGVRALGKVSEVTHRRYSDLAAAAGFKG